MLQRFPGKVSFSKYSPQTDYLDSISLLALLSRSSSFFSSNKLHRLVIYIYIYIKAHTRFIRNDSFFDTFPRWINRMFPGRETWFRDERKVRSRGEARGYTSATLVRLSGAWVDRGQSGRARMQGRPSESERSHPRDARNDVVGPITFFRSIERSNFAGKRGSKARREQEGIERFQARRGIGVGQAREKRGRVGEKKGRGREEGIHELQNAIIGICPRGITIHRGCTWLREWVAKLLYRVCNLSSMKPAISSQPSPSNLETEQLCRVSTHLS